MNTDSQLSPGLPAEFAAFRQRCACAAEGQLGLPLDLVVLSRLFSFVSMRMEELFDRVLAPWALNNWSWLVLVMVYWRGDQDITPTDISRALSVARANVTRVTDELVKRGLLHREPSQQDRRVLRLSVTEAGRQLVQEVLPHSWAAHRAIWSQTSPEQLAGAMDLLSAIAKGIELHLAGLPATHKEKP